MRVILIVLALLAASGANASSDFRFSNEPGSYGVGLRIVKQYDYTRPFRERYDPMTGQAWAGESARPLQTLIWYPAEQAGTPLVYGDYVRAAVSEKDFTLTEAEAAKRADGWVTNSWQIGAPRLQQEMRRPMWAIRDAKPLAGHYPVIVYAPSFSASAHENADLCEYLASQGYIVVSSPSLGANSKGLTHDVAGVEAQVGDIEFLIAYARSIEQADMGHVAVVGYSWGGISNVFAAAKDSRIKALVALDGSVRYFPKIVDQAGYVSGTSIIVPTLFVAARTLSVEDNVAYGVDTSGSFLNQLKYADLYKVTMAPMEHGNFSSEFQRFAPDGRFVEYSRDETSVAYSWTARYVAQFLNAYLKNDASARTFLAARPVDLGAPAHMATVEVRLAKGEPPVLQTLVKKLGERGFDHAVDVYREMEKGDSGFKPDEETLRHWGYQLLFAGETKKSIAIFQLTATIYPDSWNAFDCLAEAYMKDGNKPLAIQNYRRSLALGPQNVNAVDQLKLLGVKP